MADHAPQPGLTHHAAKIRRARLRRQAREPAVLMTMFLLAGAALVADLVLPLGVATGVVYVFVVLFAGLIDRRYVAVGAAVFCSLLMLGGLALSPPGPEFWIGLTNRIMALAGIWTAALFITARARATSNAIALAESEERSAQIIDAALDAVVSVDLSGTVVAWNPQAEQMFGWKQDHAIGRSLQLLVIPQRDRNAFEAGLSQFVRTGESLLLNRAVEMSAVRNDGVEFPVEITVLPIQRKGRMHFTAFIRDITHRRESQQQLERVADELETRNEEMEEIVSIIAHDLKRPIVSISGLLNMIKEDAESVLDEESIENLDLSINECLRMQSMVTELGALARAERADWSFMDINIRDLIEGCVRNAEPIAHEQHARVIVECPDVHIQVSPRHIRECLTNLIENALHYACPQPGMTVNVSAQVREQERLARISVSDEGPGIEREQQSRVFELFRRGDSGAAVEGSGIGLFAVRRLIQQIGGTITLESDLEKGASFTLSFPIRVSSSQPEMEPQMNTDENRERTRDEGFNFFIRFHPCSSAAPNDGRKDSLVVVMESVLVRPMNVLLVEDDLVHAKLMRRAMRGFDQLDITHVADGDSALDALLAGNELDLILLDLRLPRRDGFEVLEAVRSRECTQRVPVVIVSTSDRPDEIARSYKLGANAYLCKPVEFEKMIAAIRAMAEFWIRTLTQSPPHVGF